MKYSKLLLSLVAVVSIAASTVAIHLRVKD